MIRIVQAVLVDTSTGDELTLRRTEGRTVEQLAEFVRRLGGDE